MAGMLVARCHAAKPGRFIQAGGSGRLGKDDVDGTVSEMDLSPTVRVSLEVRTLLAAPSQHEICSSGDREGVCEDLHVVAISSEEGNDLLDRIGARGGHDLHDVIGVSIPVEIATDPRS